MEVRKNFLQLDIFFLIVFLKEVVSNRDVLGDEIGSSWSADPLGVDADTLIWYFDQKMIVIHSNCVAITLFPTNRHQKY